jgi:hypothetical protein
MYDLFTIFHFSAFTWLWDHEQLAFGISENEIWRKYALALHHTEPVEPFREAKPHPPASSGSSGSTWGLAIPMAAFFERIMEELEQREEGLYYQSAYIPY